MVELCPEVGPVSEPTRLNIFYGTPARVIAEWCQVHANTAYQYKRGDRVPSPQSRKLFLLHRDGRVLNDSWVGWRIHGDRLVDPEGQITTQGQLRAYVLVYQLAAELVRQHPEARARFDAIFREAV